MGNSQQFLSLHENKNRTMAKRTRRKIFWIIGVVWLLVAGMLFWCMRPHRNAIPTVTVGSLERFPQFTSRFIQPRDVVIWLPEGYQTGDSCDVLYAHDGNMLFDAKATWNRQEWRVDEIMDSLMQAGKIRPCIVVGIYNTEERIAEYLPTKAAQYIAEAGRKDVDMKRLTADAYLKFIVEELKPFIDGRYKPLTDREHTFMMGSSMGGLISLYALCEYPQVFGGVACLSSHLSMAHVSYSLESEQWANGFRNYVTHNLPEANGSLVYMDHGTEAFDKDYGKYQELLDTVFRSKGWDEQHYKSLVFQGQGHNEAAWSARLDQPLLYLLGK